MVAFAVSRRASATASRGHGRRPLPSACGFSLVELLVGLSVGLVIAAGATAFLATTLREQRAVLLESRLMQDLRTAADVVARDLRRAGYWASAPDGAWLPGARTAVANPYAAITPAGAASDAVGFAYSCDAAENDVLDGNEQFGFRLRSGAIQMQLGAGNWQALTDAGTLVVTAFDVMPEVQVVSLEAACPAACPASSAACPPRLLVRSLAVHIAGHALADPAVLREMRSSVRLRNDPVVGACN
jgi:type IV pilus assembly protein PilW